MAACLITEKEILIQVLFLSHNLPSHVLRAVDEAAKVVAVLATDDGVVAGLAGDDLLFSPGLATGVEPDELRRSFILQ